MARTLFSQFCTSEQILALRLWGLWHSTRRGFLIGRRTLRRSCSLSATHPTTRPIATATIPGPSPPSRLLPSSPSCFLRISLMTSVAENRDLGHSVLVPHNSDRRRVATCTRGFLSTTRQRQRWFSITALIAGIVFLEQVAASPKPLLSRTVHQHSRHSNVDSWCQRGGAGPEKGKP